ncbi:hypothetical protein Hanom_Chr11g00982001 [Helianthus anomalus]
MVYMVCQNKARGEEAVSKIQSSTRNQTKCSLGGTYGMTELLLPLLEKS